MRLLSILELRSRTISNQTMLHQHMLHQTKAIMDKIATKDTLGEGSRTAWSFSLAFPAIPTSLNGVGIMFTTHHLAHHLASRMTASLGSGTPRSGTVLQAACNAVPREHNVESTVERRIQRMRKRPMDSFVMGISRVESPYVSRGFGHCGGSSTLAISVASACA